MKSAASQTKSLAEINTWYDADELRWAARHWAVRIGVKTPQIHLQPMRTRWASISTNGRMTLNTDLLDLPKELGEFVIVHELVHLLVPNHGRVFKSFMYAYMPDWETRERRLQAHTNKTTKKLGKSLNIRKIHASP